MKTEPPWLQNLLAVASSLPETSELPHTEVAFQVSGKKFGFAFPPPRITSGASAAALLEGSDSTFQQILSGALTPQRAFVSGLLSLSGDAEALLRVTALFAGCAASARQ